MKSEDGSYPEWGQSLRIIYPVPEGIHFRRARFQQIFQTSHALARQGCEVDLLIGRNSIDPVADALPYYGLVEHKNLRIHSIAMLRREEGRFLRVSWDGFFLVLCGMKMRRLLRQRAYQAIFTRHLKPAAFFSARGSDFKLPIIFEAHEIFHLTTERNKRAEKIRQEEARIYPRMDGVVAITRGLADKMKEVFSLQAPVMIAPDGVNLDFFDIPLRREVRKKIVYVGQLYPWKGTEILVEAMAYLPLGELHLVGGSEERIQILRKRASQLGVADRVFSHGQVPLKEVKSHLADAAVAVLPLTQDLISASFTSPLKLFEYMAARVPLVASDLPSTREVLSHGMNALLVPPGDPRALGEAIRNLLENRSLAEGLARKAREGVEEYAWDRRAEKIIRFIRSLKRGGR
jgi:glycosyltransferase involved in cell wall biosynthesis